MFALFYNEAESIAGSRKLRLACKDFKQAVAIAPATNFLPSNGSDRRHAFTQGVAS
ncbi:Hypothetical protein HEAR1447 [Herminiimonas arsenicoxydans]|uniref:Uncharacterized protein n=1 Tax=Herminiimonas arsenicoxydans TaxID=204773 RepID=A4G531_HERAR|nr:Hypothetical protein HEAR1447 [Herminiimonas arsenicoxydans]